MFYVYKVSHFIYHLEETQLYFVEIGFNLTEEIVGDFFLYIK